MRRRIFVFSAFLAGMFLFSQNLIAAAIPSKTPDDLADKYGNMLKPDDFQSFTKEMTLPTGTKVSIKIIARGTDKKAVDEIIKYAFSETSRIANLLDARNEEGEVALVNKKAGKEVVPVGKEFIQIAEDAKEASRFSNGAFKFVVNGNPSDLKIDKNRLTAFLTKKNMSLDFGGILDGYLADKLITIIYNANIDNAFVSVGGASRSIGKDVTGAWRLLVTDENAKGYARRGISLTFTNTAVATVGNGNPPPPNIKGGAVACRGVTLLAPKASIAQAIASGVYLLGPEKGMSLLKNKRDIKAVIMDEKGDFIKSPGL